MALARAVCVLAAVLGCVLAKQAAPHPMNWFRGHNTELIIGNGKKIARDVESQWFEQLVDHFDPLNHDTWQQLYYVNDQWFNGSGPVFFYFNGEAPLSPSAVTSDYFVTELAQRYGALLVTHEHRYYGQSFPVADLATKNMKYLSTEQALADAASFQQWMMDNYALDDNQWVIMGGSYSGFLATAYRIKYPHLVVAAYSSSGVVLPIEDYSQYWEVINQDYTWDSKCYKNLKNVSDSVAQLWAQGKSGREELRQMFGICTELSESDEADFWYTVSGPSAGAAQYGYTADICSVLNVAQTPLKGWAFLFTGMGTKFAGIDWAVSCIDIYWKQAEANTTLYKPYTDARTWLWQTCTEFGWFQTQTTIDLWSPLINLDYYLDACSVMFEKDMAPIVQNKITTYGGLKPESSKIVSCAGLADPWHPACQLSTYKSDEPVIYIEAHDASHCKDMSAPSSADSDEMKNARKTVEHYLDEWLLP
eukprot:TRINITY_DN18012_c0_g1_i1.p2 TRINITY_DN18012_c0_g1~~TRINITY_DN18012_c0_g1_i1.p2  ORF type:complete len:485 (+),score=148.05 TRINITY_DN18012_c0_g1_i1:25-1455(+)